MTIKDLVKELTDYASYSDKGMYTEVRGYVGMTAKAARERLDDISEADEYVVDDFLQIRNLDTGTKLGFMYIAFEDIKGADE